MNSVFAIFRVWEFVKAAMRKGQRVLEQGDVHMARRDVKDTCCDVACHICTHACTRLFSFNKGGYGFLVEA